MYAKHAPGLEPGIRGLQPLALAAWPRVQKEWARGDFRTEGLHLSATVRFLHATSRVFEPLIYSLEGCRLIQARLRAHIRKDL